MAGKGVTGFPVNYVAIVIGYETQNGIEEVVHQVDGKKNDILSVVHSIERKKKTMTDKEGSITGHESTGEEILNLKVRYIKG
jgi:hypothetical protein